MTGRPDEVRRQRVERSRPPELFDLVVAAACLGVGLVLPLLRGADATVAVLFLLGVLLGAAVCFLPSRARGPAWFVGALAGVALALQLVEGRWGLLAWIFGYLLGTIGGSDLRHVLRNRSRTPEQDRQEQEAAAATVRLTWDDGAEECQLLDPDRDTALDAVRALDGERRTTVSIFRGARRLDVAGDARGALMVYQSDDRTDPRTPWHHLIDPASPDPEAEVVVAVGRRPGHFRRSQTAALDAALQAVEHFLATGHRSPDLAWHGGRDVVDMRAPLGSTD